MKLIPIILHLMLLCLRAGAQQQDFFEKHCYDCHDATDKKGNLDLTALKPTFSDAENFAMWVKVFDRIESGEMPPKQKARPAAKDTAAVTKWLRDSLVAAEQTQMPGVAFPNKLPVDASAHRFDKNSAALDTPRGNVASYLAAADRVLAIAIATQPQAPVAIWLNSSPL